MINIVVSRDTGMNFERPIRELLSIWIEIEKHKDNEIVIDFSERRFCSCTFLLAIHLLYRKYLQQGCRLSLNINCSNASISSLI